MSDIEIIGDLESWFAAYEQGVFGKAWDTEQQKIQKACNAPLLPQVREHAELMRMCPTLDASDD